jgi:hypothetical protein
MVTDEERARIREAVRRADYHLVARKKRYKIIGRAAPQPAVTAQHAPATVVGTRSPPPKLKAQQ